MPGFWGVPFFTLWGGGANETCFFPSHLSDLGWDLKTGQREEEQRHQDVGAGRSSSSQARLVAPGGC